MYYGRENSISISVGGKYIDTYGRNAEPVKKLSSLLLSVLGVLPPFNASVDGDKAMGAFDIIFFNDFDNRTIAPEKMLAIVDAMNATGEYEVTLIAFSGRELSVKYHKI